MSRKVSIILSTYNEALVIEDTINQIFSSLDDVEIILVDDNSSDGTFEIVKNVKLISPDLDFSSRVESRIQKNSGSFAKGIKSNASWQASWKKTQEIDEKKS